MSYTFTSTAACTRKPTPSYLTSSRPVPSPPFRHPLRAPFIVQRPRHRVLAKLLAPAEPRHPLPRVKPGVLGDLDDHLRPRFEDLLDRTVHACRKPGQTRRRTGQEDVLSQNAKCVCTQ